ncbi:hypothetical protein FisN_4Hh094 [Fistulifera solaris]|jgi:hypothetical protein|uniref:Uncharacterized protein n=1 Tax=Fistulifera solaris TaxID=1519565 RepID=A0A1Z5KEG6_FISSO|nr:hypothetical protein FisN_4Hh094 [Fistulifera solaris]|eukprot:GAX24576.1 hypothetical protein FisN_4Hh094 [Fistulifera solaris]
MHKRSKGDEGTKKDTVVDDDSSTDPLLIAASSDEDDDPQSKRKAAPATLTMPTMLQKYKDVPLRWLKFYVRFLQTSPFHQDRLLKALQWTLWLASAIALDAKNATASAALSKLSTELSFARYATRLLELPTAVEAAITGSWTSVSLSRPKFTTWMGRCLSWSMIGYYPLEMAAYVLWMLPTRMQTPDVSQKASKFSAISCRFWLLYILADAAQCSVLENEEKTEKKKTHLRLQLLRNALFLLPAIHWSLPNWDTKPWLPSKAVNGLMWVEAMVSLYQTSRTVAD